LAVIAAKEQSLAVVNSQSVERTPWFCSGCPHNTSTRVPEGSRAVAGIGCHFMSIWMNRSTVTFSQMGGEGVSWVGQAPFSKDKHVFANLGDGTYYHSGLLAIRQSIAAKVNITYKILFNDAVAMTGGQPVDGTLGVPAMTRELEAEGVRQIVVVTDEPEKYEGVSGLAPGVTVRHRDDLDAVQRTLRDVPGCTVLIYDQTCATEKRRRRKRGKLATPAKTVLIHEGVCEGCGDCSVQSNCLSVETVSTEFGRKRRINQNTCNKDFSCVKGFCPSFVTVEGGTLKKASPASRPAFTLPPVPEPVLPEAQEAWGIVVGGVGGTGVITIGQLLGMAAHLDGKGIVTQDAGGLAQKGGATWSHVQIAGRPDRLFTTKVDMAKADLVIGCDPIVTAHRATLSVMQAGRTFVAFNTHGTPTAGLLQNADWEFPHARCEAALRETVGSERVGAFDAEEVAVQLLGDSIYTNPMMLGYAWQKGQVPLSHAALMRAMELNGVQVPNNQAAFEWGRRCAHDLNAVKALFQARQVIEFVKKPSLEEVVQRRVEFLTAYQDAAYAESYRAFVQRVQQAETQATSGGTRTRLSEAVAHNLFKLMAYKDEYEVARLHTDPAFMQKIRDMFEGDFRVVHHLAPPALARRNEKGELQKQAFGPWVRVAFSLLRRLKFLRGTALDPFGHTAERRSERQWITHYRSAMEEVLKGLTPDRLDAACEIARIAQDVRGFGHVKERHQAAAARKLEGLLAQWRA
jgi:indolepyruvate ferredoxin oxidoreductase